MTKSDTIIELKNRKLSLSFGEIQRKKDCKPRLLVSRAVSKLLKSPIPISMQDKSSRNL